MTQKWFGCLVLLLLSTTWTFGAEIPSSTLTYAQTHALRFSAVDNLEDWILPFYRVMWDQKFKSDLFYSFTPETHALLKAVNEKSDSVVQQVLSERMGMPYEAELRFGLQSRIKKVRQSIAANAFAVVVANNPVLPTATGMLGQDITSNTSYDFEIKGGHILTPKLTLGFRKALAAKYQVADFLTEQPKKDLESKSFDFFSEFSLREAWLWRNVFFLFEVNSVPLTKQAYSYWNTNMGVRSAGIKDAVKKIRLTSVDFYFTYSPFYAGSYDVGETFRLGTGLEFFSCVNLDIFWRDFWLDGAFNSKALSPGLMLKFKKGNFNLLAFAYNKINSEYNSELTRHFGFDLSLIF